MTDSWDEWLSNLDGDKHAAAVALRDRFSELGADEPESWARSEIVEGIPQLARFLILRKLWADAING
jgi:hypothetical protein